MELPTLIPIGDHKGLTTLLRDMPGHAGMIEKINRSMLAVQESTSMFFKAQSQFMDNMLTIACPTPLRNIRQVLAQMQRTHEAVRELHLKIMKTEATLTIKHREIESESDELRRDLIRVEICELNATMEASKGYLSGAIRQLTNYTDQYDSLCRVHDVSGFTEEDFENEEERYHIMTAFTQAVNSARSKGGIVDEGNFIYFHQIGINGAHAQYEITRYLNDEASLLKQGKAPTHKMFLMFLDHMAEHFAGCSKEYAKYKGMAGTHTETALLTRNT